MANETKSTNPANRLFGLLCENEKMAGNLVSANRALVIENEKFASDLISSNKELVIENEKLASELITVTNELNRQQGEKAKRIEALRAANQELVFRQDEKEDRAAELVIANDELHFQQGEKEERAAELVVANNELVFQQGEKQKRVEELALLNEELVIESERGKRASELVIANKMLASQNEIMRKRAEELVIANKDRIELLAQLLQSQKLESLGTLAGGVAHDINNVLGAILGLATAHLEIQPVESPAYRAFETISKAAVRGGKMAKSLLNFARQSPAEEHELDINAILHEEVRLLERTTLAKVNLEMKFAPDLRPMRGDASALTHAFMNLCVNAVDAMPENGTLTLRTQNIDNDWIEVAVEDTGTGMSKDVMEKALDPFFTTKGEGKGTGLGLSMVHSTVKAHRGLLEIQSEPGRGTRVKIRFPACEPMVRSPESAPGIPFGRPLGVLSVLIVDDDELIQSSTGTILELLGHKVSGAFSGEGALEQMATGFRPDVIILDINMPGLGGARTLKRLRELYPTLPVLLSTGRVDQTALDLVAAYPMVALLPKPFTLKELQGHLQPFQSK